MPDPVEELSRRPRSRAQPDPKPAKKQEVPLPGGYAADAARQGNVAVAVQVLEGQSNQVDAAERVSEQGNTEPAEAPAERLKLSGELSQEDKAYVQELKARDREVRAHEAAHATAGSGYTSRPNFEYAVGPDGVQYAVGGHVSIDTSSVPDDPEATIAKMEVVQRAALAPARPSGQDRSVAAAAEQALRTAEFELQEKRSAEQRAQLEGSGDSKTQELALFGESLPHSVGGDASPPPTIQEPVAIGIDLIA